MLNADRNPLTAGWFRTFNARHGGMLTAGWYWGGGTGHNIYRGQGGNIDYNEPVAVMLTGASQVTIGEQDLPANTLWHYVRRQVSGCGLESPDSDMCAVHIDSAGDMTGNSPNPPVSLAAEPAIGGRIQLRWGYTRLDEELAPTGFNIYQDSGSGFDFETPAATILFSGGNQREYSWLSGALSHGQRYRYIVRSYRTGAGEEKNERIASAVADSQGPAAITDIFANYIEV